jgi:hypothetical protein
MSPLNKGVVYPDYPKGSMVTKKTTSRKSSTLKIQRYTTKGWYMAGPLGSGFPLGAGSCLMCRRVAKPHDVVYAFKIHVEWNQTMVKFMHKDCMVISLEVSPLSKFDEIKARLEAGGKFFDE